jgi:hypothetical protein
VSGGSTPLSCASAAQAELLAENGRWEYENLPYWGGEVDCCINVWTVANGLWLGADITGIVYWFLEHRLPDGGWNCAWIEGATRSSFHSTLNSLKGLLAYDVATGGTDATHAARRSGEEYLLQRGLFRRLSTGEPVGPWVDRFAYPFRWYYNVLNAAEYFRQASLLDGAAPDPRMADAIEVIRAATRVLAWWDTHCPTDDSTFTIANRCNGSRVRRPKMSGDAASVAVMSSTAAPFPAPPGGGAGAVVSTEAVAAELKAMLARLGELTDAATVDTREADRATDTARIDAIALTEQVASAAAGTQAALTVRFARSQVTTTQQQAAQDDPLARDPRKMRRGIADQLALACHVNPTEGTRRLNEARALHAELPATYALLRAGQISAYVAGLVVTETRHLDPQQRREVDAQVVAGGLADCAPRQAAALAKRHAYAADPQGYMRRSRTARTDRRVGLRPAPDTMSVLSAFLPVEQGVACWAALRRHTDGLKSSGDPRARNQIMADTLTERVTGQATAGDVQAEVGIVIPVTALTHPTDPTADSPVASTADAPADSTAGAAEVVGHGPIPTPIAMEILAKSQGRRWWRRLFTAAHGGIVGGDPGRRRFDGTLATLIGYRDGGRCREPFCDAPAREIDHIIRHRNGGPTSFTNGRSTCVRTNQVREIPGWDVQLVHDGLAEQPHTVATTTPTGHTYTSRAGPAP